MKNKMILGFLFLPLLLQPILANYDKGKHENSIMPPQISEFYEGYNFITSFSTGAERKMLIEKYGQFGLPKDMKKERLGRVFDQMKKLKDQFYVMDSEMVLWVGPTPKFWKFHFRPVLFEVIGVSVSGDTAVVGVASYTIEPETILRFISDYDGRGDTHKAPSLKERILQARCSDPEKVFHRWICQNGHWKMRAADLYLLEEKK